MNDTNDINSKSDDINFDLGYYHYNTLEINPVSSYHDSYTVDINHMVFAVLITTISPSKQLTAPKLTKILILYHHNLQKFENDLCYFYRFDMDEVAECREAHYTEIYGSERNHLQKRMTIIRNHKCTYNIGPFQTQSISS